MPHRTPDPDRIEVRTTHVQRPARQIQGVTAPIEITTSTHGLTTDVMMITALPHVLSTTLDVRTIIVTLAVRIRLALLPLVVAMIPRIVILMPPQRIVLPHLRGMKHGLGHRVQPEDGTAVLVMHGIQARIAAA